MSKELTKHVVTRWYRAPEVILMNEFYSYSIDMWSVGCIFAELLNKGRPILPGRNEIDQYLKICDLIGKPRDRDDWKDFFKLEIIRHSSSNTTPPTQYTVEES